MRWSKQRRGDGFTLVEMLIVVGIIGVLASMVAVTILGTARQDASESAIRANLTQVRTIAADIADEDGTYATLCSSGTLNEGHPNHPQIGGVESEVEQNNGGNPVVCGANESTYCVSSVLPSGDHLCIDDSGTVNEVSNPDCTNGPDHSCP